MLSRPSLKTTSSGRDSWTSLIASAANVASWSAVPPSASADDIILRNPPKSDISGVRSQTPVALHQRGPTQALEEVDRRRHCEIGRRIHRAGPIELGSETRTVAVTDGHRMQIRPPVGTRIKKAAALWRRQPLVAIADVPVGAETMRLPL